MKIDAYLRNGLDHVEEDVRISEEAGFDGAFNGEGNADPFLPIALAAANTSRLELGSAVAVAFARNPMNVAYQAIDLQRYSGGRFILGLGSQVKPHIEKRFSMPWSQPAARMKEFVLALRAIWDAWATGDALRFEGEFYRHTLMTENFTPVANPFASPKVYLAAVGPHMLRTAAQVADGVFVHPMTTEHFLKNHIIPSLASARPPGMPAVEIAISPFVALDEADIEAVRWRIAFYASTPAYRPVLDAHGWGDIHQELNAMSKRREWGQMAAKVDDELVHAMCSIGTEREIAQDLLSRYGDVADRIRFNRPDDNASPSRLTGIAQEMRGLMRGSA